VRANFVQGILRAVHTQALDSTVTRVVHTNHGELNWTIADSSGYTAKKPLARRRGPSAAPVPSG